MGAQLDARRGVLAFPKIRPNAKSRAQLARTFAHPSRFIHSTDAASRAALIPSLVHAPRLATAMQVLRVPLRVSGVSGGALRAARRGVASAPRGARRVRSRSSTVLVHAAGPSGVKVVGVGSAGVDYLASIASFPEPDAKLRTDALEVQGGGNCGNACTAMARLGLSLHPHQTLRTTAPARPSSTSSPPTVWTPPPSSSNQESPPPFTYIIVDRAGSTRTCIHTPGPEFRPSEFTPDAASSLVDGAALVYFDGRLTEVALNVAAAAREKDIPVLVEGERTRENLPELLRMGDYVCTSAGYPKEYTGEASTETAMVKLFAELPRARAMVTTLGKRGAVMLRRVNDWDGEETRATLRETLRAVGDGGDGGDGGGGRARIRRGPHPRAPVASPTVYLTDCNDEDTVAVGPVTVTFAPAAEMRAEDVAGTRARGTRSSGRCATASPPDSDSRTPCDWGRTSPRESAPN